MDRVVLPKVIFEVEPAQTVLRKTKCHTLSHPGGPPQNVMKHKPLVVACIDLARETT